MKILALSDTISPFIYGAQVRSRFTKVDLIIGCGDLPYYYLEYVMDALNAPLFYVRGNHDKVVEYNSGGQRTAPTGGTNLHRQVFFYESILLAGVEGSLRYSTGEFQYSQSEMWRHVLQIVPSLLLNKIKYGRYLDIFISHAAAEGLHDMPDLPHQGIKAFGWLLRVFQPAYHLHGHVHVYRPDTVTETFFGRTQVINTFGFREIELDDRLK